jgi:hypothetical protein
MLKANQAETFSYMQEETLPPEHNREANSTHRFSRLELQRAMTDVKFSCESRLESDLNLVKVGNHQPKDQPRSSNPSLSSYSTHFITLLYMQHAIPFAFTCGTGVNDELDGTISKSAVQFKFDDSAPFDSPYEMQAEIVQSFAKWKRIMLNHLGCQPGEVVYCDSTSVRKATRVTWYGTV